MPSIEIIQADHPRGDFRAAIFDFDGTLSLLRRNWQDVMIPMMVEVLLDTPQHEGRERLSAVVEDFVMRLNGKQTIYQMLQLCQEVEQRGGRPRDALEYKREYHNRLYQQVGQRVEAVREGRVAADEMTVPGSRELLQELSRRQIALYLASGTDLTYVREELQVLGLDSYFGSHVYGALDDYKRFSKAMIVQQILKDCRLQGSQVLGFGDGFVEIEEVKRVGGLAIGVASNEDTRQGVNQWKRQRLIRAGADIIMADYQSCHQWLAPLLG